MLSEEEEEFDVIIVGGGPAGLNAAIMCDTRHLKVLLLEKDKLGGLLASLYPTKTIPNYPGFPEITAIELVRNWLANLRFSGVTVKKETALSMTNDLVLTTDRKTYRTKVVVIATGAKPRRLGLPNEERFSRDDKGVYYFPSHKEAFLGKRVVVVGGGDTAIDATLEMLNLAKEITLVHRKEGFRAFEMNVDTVKRSGLVDFVMRGEVKAIEGKDRVEGVVIQQQQKVFRKDADAVIISIGLVPEDSFFKNLEIKRDRGGFILTDRAQRTSVEGVFAIGDVVQGGLRLITVAAAHGAIASHYIYSYVKRPYWTRGKWPQI
jgi:thioredoxin reductase (NADPH)